MKSTSCRWWIGAVVCGVLVVVGAFGALAFRSHGDDPEGAVRDFVAATAQGGCDASDELTTESYRPDEPDCETFQRSVSPRELDADLTINSSRVDAGEKVTATTTQTYDGEGPEKIVTRFRYTLVKVADMWRIDAVDNAQI